MPIGTGRFTLRSAWTGWQLSAQPCRCLGQWRRLGNRTHSSHSALGAEPLLILRVFGRLPVTDVTRCSEAGVRKASGEETAGEFAPAVVSVYGDLACVCPDLWISNGDHGRVIIVALALVAACRIGTVVF